MQRRRSPLELQLQFALLAAALLYVSSTPVEELKILDEACKKVIWMSGVQIKDYTGQQSQYIGNAQAYLQAYVASLLSAKDAAPSLLPVLVYEGVAPPRKFVDWVTSQGAIVLNHNLTIRPQLIHAAQNPKVAHTRSLWGSYLRMEPHLIMDKLVPEIINSKGGGFLSQVDTKYILWTDPDVIFYKNIDSCTIPKPHILSVGPDASKDGTGNCGVIYYNLRSYRLLHPALVRFGDRTGWAFNVADQDAITGFLQLHRMSLLPNTFNYKPYWGALQMGPLWGPYGEVAIAHTHGPKIDQVLCMHKYINESSDLFVHNKSLRWSTMWPYYKERAPEVMSAMTMDCDLRSNYQMQPSFAIALHSWWNDRGLMYHEIKKRKERLLVGIDFKALNIDA